MKHIVEVERGGWRLTSDAQHRYESSWPPRLVMCNTVLGWKLCLRCKTKHRMWFVDYNVWERVPAKWRKKQICVNCFRVLVKR